jgi:hypothetical protein
MDTPSRVSITDEIQSAAICRKSDGTYLLGLEGFNDLKCVTKNVTKRSNNTAQYSIRKQNEDSK